MHREVNFPTTTPMGMDQVLKHFLLGGASNFHIFTEKGISANPPHLEWAWDQFPNYFCQEFNKMTTYRKVMFQAPHP